MQGQQDIKRMNLVQLTFIVAVNMMGSGIIMLPTNMAQVGAISLLSWIVTALGSMAIAYGFAQAGMFNQRPGEAVGDGQDRKSTRLNSSHVEISYAVFCLKKKKKKNK